MVSWLVVDGWLLQKWGGDRNIKKTQTKEHTKHHQIHNNHRKEANCFL